MPARGPRSDLCVVVVTMSQNSNGCAASSAATRPLRTAAHDTPYMRAASCIKKSAEHQTTHDEAFSQTAARRQPTDISVRARSRA